MSDYTLSGWSTEMRHADGSVTVVNEHDFEIYVEVSGRTVRVDPHTEFHGTAEIQTHTLRHAISQEAVTAALNAQDVAE